MLPVHCVHSESRSMLELLLPETHSPTPCQRGACFSLSLPQTLRLLFCCGVVFDNVFEEKNKCFCNFRSKFCFEKLNRYKIWTQTCAKNRRTALAFITSLCMLFSIVVLLFLILFFLERTFKFYQKERRKFTLSSHFVYTTELSNVTFIWCQRVFMFDVANTKYTINLIFTTHTKKRNIG